MQTSSISPEKMYSLHAYKHNGELWILPEGSRTLSSFIRVSYAVSPLTVYTLWKRGNEVAVICLSNGGDGGIDKV